MTGRVVRIAIAPVKALGLVHPESVELHHDAHASRAVLGPWQEALSAYARTPLRLLWSQTGAPDRTARGGSVSLVSRGSLERLQSELGAGERIGAQRAGQNDHVCCRELSAACVSQLPSAIGTRH